jgi:glutamine synthetase
MEFAQREELDAVPGQNPDIELLEVLMPDMNGLLRCKRIQRQEFAACSPVTSPCRGRCRSSAYAATCMTACPERDRRRPDQILRPVSRHPGAHALVRHTGGPGADRLRRGDRWPRLDRSAQSAAAVLDRYRRTAALRDRGHGAGVLPARRRQRPAAGAPGRAHARDQPAQEGIQYCMPDDLYDCNELPRRGAHRPARCRACP